MEGDIESAFVDIRRGDILELVEGSLASARLRGLAAAVPELLATGRFSWGLVFGVTEGASAGVSGLEEVVLVSARWVHVAHRVPSDPCVALLTLAPRDRSMGMIVSEARRRASRHLE